MRYHLSPNLKKLGHSKKNVFSRGSSYKIPLYSQFRRLLSFASYIGIVALSSKSPPNIINVLPLSLKINGSLQFGSKSGPP